MKLFHLSDLHLGKRVNEFSMLEDQKYILKQILQRIDEEQPDGVILAGDIYDKPVPPAEAVELFDEFLVELSQRGIQTFIISGNHDSAERLAFGGRLMEGSGIHLSPVYDAKITQINLEDEFGAVDLFLLPFIKPAHVRRFCEEEAADVAAAAPRSGSVSETGKTAGIYADSRRDEAPAATANQPDPAAAPEIKTWTNAIRAAIARMNIDPNHRNVLVTHQFVTGAVRSDSEEISLSVGGTDNVDAAVFSDFDYVALGHIHRPQNMGGGDRHLEANDARENVTGQNAPDTSTTTLPLIRYCGAPLKYSFSEANHEKSITVVELGEKGSVDIQTIPLNPLRDMIELRGTYDELTAKSFYENTSYPGDYVHITLTDEDDIPEAMGRLRVIYPYLMKLDYDNRRTRTSTEIQGASAMEEKTPGELFAEFYEMQNNAPLSAEQKGFLDDMIRSIWGKEDAR